MVIGEGKIADLRHAGGEGDGGQPLAAEEGAVADVFQVDAALHSGVGEIIAGVEGPALDPLQTVGEVDDCELVAALEGLFIDDLDGVAEIHGPQRVQTEEGALAHVGDAGVDVGRDQLGVHVHRGVGQLLLLAGPGRSGGEGVILHLAGAGDLHGVVFIAVRVQTEIQTGQVGGLLGIETELGSDFAQSAFQVADLVGVLQGFHLLLVKAIDLIFHAGGAALAAVAGEHHVVLVEQLVHGGLVLLHQLIKNVCQHGGGTRVGGQPREQRDRHHQRKQQG